MFEDINVSGKTTEGSRCDGNFKNTLKLVDGIASIAQGWLDPRVSPEIREQYFRDILISKEGFSRLSKAAIKLYFVELPTEEVRVIPGIYDFGYHVLFIDGCFYIPVESSWRLFEDPMQYGNEFIELPRYKLKKWFVLGR